MNRQVYIEAWRNRYDGEHWLASVRDTSNPLDTDYPASYFANDGWSYWYSFRGKRAYVIFCSHDAFTRSEAIAIALLIVEGRGVKAWRIELE